jgi:hypothetical protein
MVHVYKLIILLLISSGLHAQVVQERNARGADRIIILKDGFRVPIRDTATAPALLNYSGDSSRGGVVYDSTLQKLCFWTGVRWVCLDDSATGGSIDTTSLSNRINLKLNISDTATMLNPYIRGIGAGTNVTVDNTNPRFPIVNAAGGGGTPGGGQFAIQYSRGGAFAGSQNFVFDSARNSVGINTLPTATGGVLRVLRNSTPASTDTIFTFLGSDNKTLTGLRSFGGQNWNMYNNATNAYTGQIAYSTPGSIALPGVVFFNSSNTGRTDIRYANNGVYFTSHSAGTNPESSNSLGVLIRGNSAATTQVGIGTAAPNADAALHIITTTKGVLLPRHTLAQRNAVSTPTRGLLVYNDTYYSHSMWTWDAWTDIYGNLVGTAPNAAYTPSRAVNMFILPEITGNRTFNHISTATSPSRVYTIFNENSSAFTWTSSIPFLDKDGTTFTVIPNDTVIQYISDGTNLRIISKY